MERSGPDDARDDAWDDGWSDAGGDDRGTDGSTASTPVSGDPGPDRGGPEGTRPSGDDLTGRFGGRAYEMFDDLDDLDDDPEAWNAYPPAPLPPHERAWRHPSEMGEAAWVRSEPPVTIGRGLLVTSGAIGSALGVAVLYLMLPTAAGTPSARPTATSSFLTERAAVVTVVDDTAAPSFVAAPASTEAWADLPGLTLPAPDTPSTVLVMSNPEVDAPVSVAVAIDGADYVVTTANALASLDVDGDGVRLLGPGSPGEVAPLDAELLSIEGDLAYLAPSPGLGRIELVSFATTATAAPGDAVTVLADVPEVVPYSSGGPVPELDAGVIVEGTPVVDADGALVALCTVVIDGDGAYVDMVPIDIGGDTTDETVPTSVADAPVPATSVVPDSPDPAPGATTATTPGATPGTVAPAGAWIGLRFDGAPASAPLTVTGVVAGSPALTAGVMVGERLVAIDGVAVSTVDDVVAVVRTHQPGDVVKLTLAPRPAGSSGSTVTSATAATSATSPSTPATSPTTTTTAPSSAAATTTSTSTTTTSPATAGGGTVAGASGGTGTGTGGATPVGTRSVSVVLGASAPTV